MIIACVVDEDIIAAVRRLEGSSRRAICDISVMRALRMLGQDVHLVAARGPATRTLRDLQDLIKLKPGLVFNLAYSATPDEASFAGALEILQIPFTGSGAVAIGIANDKLRSRHLMKAAAIPVPSFVMLPHGRAPRKFDITPPYIVKPVELANSQGIGAGSVVQTRAQAIALADKIWRRFAVPSVCDTFIVGREFHVGLVETRRSFQVTAITELRFAEAAPGFGFKSESVRTHGKVRRAHDISERVARLPRRVSAEMAEISRHAAEVLNLRGYAKIDLRMDDQGRIFVIEANANPGLWSKSPMWRRPGFMKNIRHIIDAARRRARE
jgi:D-alanine-D-alanine ligase